MLDMCSLLPRLVRVPRLSTAVGGKLCLSPMLLRPYFFLLHWYVFLWISAWADDVPVHVDLPEMRREPIVSSFLVRLH